MNLLDIAERIKKARRFGGTTITVSITDMEEIIERLSDPRKLICGTQGFDPTAKTKIRLPSSDVIYKAAMARSAQLKGPLCSICEEPQHDGDCR